MYCKQLNTNYIFAPRIMKAIRIDNDTLEMYVHNDTGLHFIVSITIYSCTCHV